MAVSAFDVADYILRRQGTMSHMKLQKLLYYAQAWSLVWDDRPLFEEKIEAWVNGPVVRAVFAEFRQEYLVTDTRGRGDARKLDPIATETLDRVLQFYGPHDSQWLSDLTHAEYPWQKAREGLAPTDRGTAEITPASMADYYSSLR